MRQLNALWRTARTGGVDDTTRGLAFQALGLFNDIVLQLLAVCNYGLIGVDVQGKLLFDQQGLNRRDKPTIPTVDGCRHQFLGEITGRDNCPFGARVAENMQMVGRGVGRVGWNRNRAERHDCDVCNRPLRPVFRTDNHAVARFDAKVFETSCQLNDFLHGLTVASRTELAVNLFPQERFSLPCFGCFEEQRWQVWHRVQRRHIALHGLPSLSLTSILCSRVRSRCCRSPIT